MEINKLKTLVSNRVTWDLLKEYLQEQIQLIQQELEVATSEQELFRNQGKLSSLRRLLSLEQQLNKKDDKSRRFF
jgi:uncharacterized protein involved in exopolysaccharide biosynthesis